MNLYLKDGRWNINAAKCSFVRVHLILTIHGQSQRKARSSLFQTAQIWQTVSISMAF